MGPIHILMIVLVSLAIGSFLNVVIHRLPRGESLAFPGSRCASCGRAIRFYDNVPLLSYAVLGGKCRFCGEKISARYPIVEGLTAFIVLALLAVYGLTVPFAAYATLAFFLIPISFIDWDTGFIPDKLVIPASIAGIFYLAAFHIVKWKVTWKSGLAGMVAGAGLLLLLMIAGKFLMKKDAMGMGDVKMLAMTGIYVGFPAVWIALFFGGVAACVYIMIALARKRLMLKNTIPFGPFIAIGTLTYLLAGDFLIQWYLGLIR
ncbi:prepilin peptidase [bacterium]|nr:prepilin peptidase [bacterium]